MEQSKRQGEAEAALIAAVNRLERKGWEWRAVHLHLSRLRASNRRPYHQAMAAGAFESFGARLPGEVFRLGNGDVVALIKGAAIEELDAIVSRLRHLFATDPLLAEPSQAAFCTWYDLETDQSRLLETAQMLEATAHAIRPRPGRRGRSDKHAAIDTAAFARLEHKLQSADLEGLVERQTVCAMQPEQPPRPVFTEFYLAIEALADRLAPGANVAGDRWLFQHLTLTLDRRMLLGLCDQPDAMPEIPLALNLNVRSVFGPAFAAFERMRAAQDAKVLVEFQLVDVFADLAAFVFARDHLRAQGYGLCLDGLHHLHLPLIDGRRLGFDHVKIAWTPDMTDGGEAMREAVADNGPDAVVLTRCDGADAIEWGLACGLRLFQGDYVESRLRALRPSAVDAARRAMRAALTS